MSRVMRLWLLLAAVALAACAAPAGQPPNPADPAEVGAFDYLDDEEMVARLRAGGNVVVLRHTATDRGSVEPNPADVTDCGQQRNLSETGRDQARAIGAAFERHGIPVGDVLTGLHCRAVDTAMHAFGRADPTRDLLHLPVAPAAEQDDLVAALEDLMATPPRDGTNTVLVTHNSNIEAVTGQVPDEGEAVVVTPDGAGGFDVVGTVPAPRPPQASAAAGPRRQSG